MNEWEQFLSLTKKLERKNKKIIFRKRVRQIIQDDAEIISEYSEKPHIVDQFSKNEKRNFIAEATLDLHGYTSKEATIEILEFLNKSYKYNKRNLAVITGGNLSDSKVLRKMFMSMCKHELSHFISKISCPTQNTGMFLIKLRKQRKQ